MEVNRSARQRLGPHGQTSMSLPTWTGGWRNKDVVAPPFMMGYSRASLSKIQMLISCLCSKIAHETLLPRTSTVTLQNTEHWLRRKAPITGATTQMSYRTLLVSHIIGKTLPANWPKEANHKLLATSGLRRKISFVPTCLNCLEAIAVLFLFQPRK